MKYFSSLLLMLFLFVSCGDDTTAVDDAADRAEMATQSTAFQNMMDGHDRVMPLMGQITQLQRTLAERMGNTELGEESRELYVAVNEQLEDANDGMMEWMGNIKSLDELREEEDTEGIMEYLQEQTRSIAKVESDMKSSIAAAKEVVGGEMHDHGDGADHDHDHDHDDADHKH